MSLLLESAPAPGPELFVDSLEEHGPDGAVTYPIEHVGLEYETVMGDVSLCCSTCCTCSSGGKQRPR